MPITITFHESQYPSQTAEQLRHGLRSRKLSSKFLYDSPAQAQRWLAYHQACSPSRTEPDLLSLYQQSFQTALRVLTSPALHYVSLGCGGGTKDVRLLQQAVCRYDTLCCTPMDVSAALVLETMQRLQSSLPDFPCFPLVVDLEVEPELVALLAAHETPDMGRVLTCFGMMPNFDYRSFLPYVRRLMRPADLLLLSANLSPTPYPDACPAIVPQYDNPLARVWFSGLLESLGFSNSDIDIHVQTHPLRPDGQVWQIRTEARFLKRVRLALYETAFDFPADDRLRLFFSNRFTPDVMPQILAAAGFRLIQMFLFESQEEGIYLCAASV